MVEKHVESAVVGAMIFRQQTSCHQLQFIGLAENTPSYGDSAARKASGNRKPFPESQYQKCPCYCFDAFANWSIAEAPWLAA